MARRRRGLSLKFIWRKPKIFNFFKHFAMHKQKYFYNPSKFENWLTESIGCLVLMKRTLLAYSSGNKILVYSITLEC